MLFTTPLFLFVFLPLFLSVYYLTPRNLQIKNTIALMGSLVFFAWGEPVFVFLLLFGTYLDYKISLYIAPEKAIKQGMKRGLLMMAIALNVTILIISKYLTFILSELLPLAQTMTVPNLPLILGISFITFHKISYLVDSYQGRALPPRHFFDCALYIFFFPQLIAGPIIRYHDIGKQIHCRQHSVNDFITGFLRFSLGLVKKVLLADPLGVTADKVFSLSSHNLSPLFAWGGIVAYTLQIYFDFSGYSDMAIGLARMVGFHFPENFNRPYIAKSITEFWQRWHISLSNWMRLYLYIPLGGNRISTLRTYANLWIVFLISGFWHGASWNFIAWGAYYGFFLCLERVFTHTSLLQKLVLPTYITRALTILIVMVGWVFFRSNTLHDAVDFISVLFDITYQQPNRLPWGVIFTNRAITTLIVGSLLALVVIPRRILFHFDKLNLILKPDPESTLSLQSISIQVMAILILLIISAAAMTSSDYSPFLYFKF